MIHRTLRALALSAPLSFSRILSASLTLASLCCATLPLHAAVPDRIAPQADLTRLQPLPNHHPLWAIPANSVAAVPDSGSINPLTLVLARSSQQQAAFQQFLADQQNPASPDYHHWLTPAEVGEHFGVSDADIATITAWLQAQGLVVDWVAPSRLFIGFSGAAAAVNHAFQTQLRTYRVSGVTRMSVASDPQIPQALAPLIASIRGLYSIDEQPQHIALPAQQASPQISTSSNTHYIGPADFSTIYDLPNLYYGSGVTIGIVGRSRTNPADFDNFKSLVGGGFTDPTEVVPTAFGGVDPGPAYTTPPGSSVSTSEQSEATLDVLRAGTVAFQSNLLLVVASVASGGIGADAQYIVNTTPLPAQVMTISYGACESAAGPSAVTYWDSLFQQAAAEGISVFVSSGDSGASGCDQAFIAPPASPAANSPNYICSSTYATCVGGTQFNDTASPSTYWASGSFPNATALRYIPEGAWNESWNGSSSIVAATGGGVSAYVATPSWQKGVTGVPAAATGRYTPDISFSSSIHDGYFACLAAARGSCVVSNGSVSFVSFAGTSAAAPGMAGVAAILDSYLTGPQGNLNPGLYQMVYGAPDAFHDATLSSSGVASCNLNTPSLCNNSIGGTAGLAGGQPGYAIGDGYDEATGLGSLDVANFVYTYATASTVMTPTVVISEVTTLPSNEPLTLIASVGGGPGSPSPTGTLVFTIGSYTSAALPISGGNSVNVLLPAGTIPVGNYTLTAAYTPDSTSATRYTSATASHALSIIVPPKVAPSMQVTPSPTIINNTTTVTVGIVVDTPQYYPTPTGSVRLTSGSYTASVVLAGGSATITVPAGSFAVGTDTFTVTYTPDSAASPSFLTSSNFGNIQNEGATITPNVLLNFDPASPTTAQPLTASIQVYGFSGNPTPTGTVVLTSGTYTSGSLTLSAASVMTTIPAGSLPPGLDAVTIVYTPDAASSATYSAAIATAHVAVTLAPQLSPSMTLVPLSANPSVTQPLSLTVTLHAAGGYSVPTGSVNVAAAGFSPVSAALVNGSATVILPTGYFNGGPNVITAWYYSDGNASYIYTNQTVSTTVTAVLATPTIAITPQPSSALTTDSIHVTVAANAGSSAPPVNGVVTLSSGSWSTASGYYAGPATFDIPAGALPPGTDTLSATYNGSNYYNPSTGTATVDIAAPDGAAFTISGASVTFASTSSGGGNSVVTVTPVSGFVGAVQLTAAITSQPAGATRIPTLSFGTTSPVSLLSFNPGTARLFVTAPASTSGAFNPPPPPRGRWYAATGASLACILFLWIPRRRRSLRNILGAIALLTVLTTGLLACGGGSSNSSGGGSGTTAQIFTTPGNYIITVTGTAGSVTTTGTVNLTVTQ